MHSVVIDLGQSGSRARVDQGETLALPIRFRRQAPLVEVVREILHSLHGVQADVVGLSLTGLRGAVSDPIEFGTACHEELGASRVALADDGLAGLFGALPSADGVSLAVGSGVAVVAKLGDQVAHRDGAGYVLGDDGAGYSIGRAGLRAALRAAEGRGQDTAILAAAVDRYGDLRVATATRSDLELHGWCIEMAHPVLECAHNGDAVAMSIRDEAAHALALTARAAWRAAGGADEDAVAISGTGGILRDVDLRKSLMEAVRTMLPGAHWLAPAGDNLDGMQRILDTQRQDLLPLLRWWSHNA